MRINMTTIRGILLHKRMNITTQTFAARRRARAFEKRWRHDPASPYVKYVTTQAYENYYKCVSIITKMYENYYDYV
jgi:hypothetical protein